MDLTAIRAALDGRKTIIIGLVMALAAGTEGGLGYDIPGYVAGPDWMDQVLTGLALIFMRRGIAKAGG